MKKGFVLNVGVTIINYGLAKAIIKVWSTFSKVVGVGKAHKYFPLTQSNNSQTARCLGGLNATANALKCDSNKKAIQ